MPRDPRQSDVDPDLVPASQPEWPVLAAISIGGVLGAEARYGVGEWITHSAAQFPASTLAINALGSLLLGVLMAVIASRERVHRLLRPFVGIGILGGFTTFSTFSVDTTRLLRLHHPALALAYLVATLASCALAVWVGYGATRRIAA